MEARYHDYSERVTSGKDLD